jgi:hypothetical protein
MKDPVWQAAGPATTTVVESLSRTWPGLPAAYLEFLRSANGGEGDLGVEPGWMQLWPAEKVAELNSQYRVPEFLPGFLGFGSNGGGELIAFNIQSGRVYMVPLVPMKEAEAVEIAPDFSSLRREFGHTAPAA